MSTDAFVCRETAKIHHFHSEKRQFYVGSAYLTVCCHCGRVQLITYRGQKETPDLVGYSGPDCGSFVR